MASGRDLNLGNSFGHFVPFFGSTKKLTSFSPIIDYEVPKSAINSTQMEKGKFKYINEIMNDNVQTKTEREIFIRPTKINAVTVRLHIIFRTFDVIHSFIHLHSLADWWSLWATEEIT